VNVNQSAIVHRIVISGDQHGIEAGNAHRIRGDCVSGCELPMLVGVRNFLNERIEIVDLAPLFSKSSMSFNEGLSRTSSTFFL